MISLLRKASKALSICNLRSGSSELTRSLWHEKAGGSAYPGM
jgi:hypothetical protein